MARNSLGVSFSTVSLGSGTVRNDSTATSKNGVSLDAERICTVDMTLTSAACPLTDVIEDQAMAALDGLVSDFRINWVWLPPWGPEKITEDGREQLRALGFNV